MVQITIQCRAPCNCGPQRMDPHVDTMSAVRHSTASSVSRPRLQYSIINFVMLWPRPFQCFMSSPSGSESCFALSSSLHLHFLALTFLFCSRHIFIFPVATHIASCGRQATASFFHRPQTKPTDLGSWAVNLVRLGRQLPSTSTITIYYYFTLAGSHVTVQRRVEG